MTRIADALNIFKDVEKAGKQFDILRQEQAIARSQLMLALDKDDSEGVKAAKAEYLAKVEETVDLLISETEALRAKVKSVQEAVDRGSEDLRPN